MYGLVRPEINSKNMTQGQFFGNEPPTHECTIEGSAKDYLVFISIPPIENHVLDERQVLPKINPEAECFAATNKFMRSPLYNLKKIAIFSKGNLIICIFCFKNWL